MLSFLFSFLAVTAQTSAVTVTMTGIGDIRLGMKKAEFEKLMDQTFKLPHLTSKNDDYYQDTVHINYKGMEADVIFQKEYRENDKYDITVWEIRSNSPQLKTKSGISIGDDKYKIISTYEGYVIGSCRNMKTITLQRAKQNPLCGYIVIAAMSLSFLWITIK
jgi:hypothetical protein